MTRLVSLAAAALASLTFATAAPAIAQGAGYYSATPTGKVTKASLVTRNTVWKCADGTCVAGKGAERPTVMCELVVQRVGALSSFAVGGAPFDAAALEKCNARAR